MKTFKNMAAQGDLLIRRIDKIPAKMKEEKPTDGHFIVAHSETGHHHTVTATPGVKYMTNPADPLIAYLEVQADVAALTHRREFDTHETINLDNGLYELRRQKEYIPGGWRQVMD